MAQLILMRHAKAVDRLEAEDDFERGLTERGRNDAAKAAQTLVDANISAEHALVSPSLRTLQTWTIVSEQLGDLPKDSPMALYHASMEMLERAALEQFAKGAQSIIMVGHNPGIGGFAHAFAAKLECMNKIPRGWPTSALGVFEVEPDGEVLQPLDMVHSFDPKSG